ncbi:MAG: SGNH/GDSL hydrolase family protein [Fibrobacteria bacterium]|nr:SGNH/GDSL hydrolase family protein [Fibrobacteria bacterium]
MSNQKRKTFIRLFLIFLFLISGIAEVVFDALFGDGDGEVLTFGISFFLPYLQTFLLLFILASFIFKRTDTLKEMIFKCILTGTISIFCFTSLEILSRILLPKPVFMRAGAKWSPKDSLYGWHDLPNHQIPFIDPDYKDTCEWTTNSEGWKDVEHTLQKPDSVKRILCIGDSYTKAHVCNKDNYSRHVENLLKAQGYNVETISMGMGCWGTDQSLEALMLEGIHYKPDIVIYQFCLNDLFDIYFEPGKEKLTGRPKPFYYNLENNTLHRIDRRQYRKERLQAIADSVKARQTFGDVVVGLVTKSFFLHHIKFLKQKYSLSSYLSPNQVRIVKDQGPIGKSLWHYNSAVDSVWNVTNKKINYQWRLLEQLMIRMDSVAKAHNAKFIVFSVSGEKGIRQWHIDHNQIYTKNDKDYADYDGVTYEFDYRKPYKFLAQLCDKNDFPLIDNKRIYNRYKNDFHTNALGNLHMAEDIVDYLVTHNFLEPH